MKLVQLRFCALATAIVAVMSAAALAGDGRPDQSTLRAMGLSGMAVISDYDALAVRGFGFGSHAEVSGSGFAFVAAHGAVAGHKDEYEAEGHHFAAGASHSEARIEIEHSIGNGNHGGHKPHRPNGNHGGNKPPKNGNHGGGWGGDMGGGWDGDMGGGWGGDMGGGWGGDMGGKPKRCKPNGGGKPNGGHHGGGKQSWSIKASAGGWSVASAH